MFLSLLSRFCVLGLQRLPAFGLRPSMQRSTFLSHEPFSPIEWSPWDAFPEMRFLDKENGHHLLDLVLPCGSVRLLRSHKDEAWFWERGLLQLLPGFLSRDRASPTLPFNWPLRRRLSQEKKIISHSWSHCSYEGNVSYAKGIVGSTLTSLFL